MFKSLTSVQLVPFQLSLAACLTSIGEPPFPPIPKAAVVVPAPPINLLAKFKSLTSVQLVPFHNSVAAELPGDPKPPPIAIAEV